MTAISVVITTHDAHQWLAEALASIRAQTHPHAQVETIVVGGADDDAAEIARAFLVCNAMQGKVLTAPAGSGVATARELGWRAAGGEWVQFLNGRDVLAPNKFQMQSGAIARLPEEVGVILSSWQRLRLVGGQWLLAGSVAIPQLSEALVVPSLASAPVGSALIRTRSLASLVAMFGDGADAVSAQLLLKIAAVAGVRAGSLCDGCVAVDSPLPLFFAREVSEPRASKLERARQQLESTLVARALLQRGALLTPAYGDALASLCRDRLHVLQNLDRAAYRSGVRRVRATDPRLLPSAQAARGWFCRRSGHGLPVEVGETHAHAGASLWSGTTMGRVAAMVVLFALLGAAVALGPLASYRGPAAQPDRVQAEYPGRPVPTIVVASTIYAEASSAWPLPVEIIPRQAVPPGGMLQISGLPSHAALSAGRRSASGAWTVPVAALANLEVEVSAGASGRSRLTLTLYSAERRVLAEVSTTIQIDEPAAHGSAAGAEVRPAAPPAALRLSEDGAPGPAGGGRAREDASGGAPESPSRELSARVEQKPDEPAATARPSSPQSHLAAAAAAPSARMLAGADAPAPSPAPAPAVPAASVQSDGETAAALAHTPPGADASIFTTAPVAETPAAAARPVIAAIPDGDAASAAAIPAEPPSTTDSAQPIISPGTLSAGPPQLAAPLNSASAGHTATSPGPHLGEATPPPAIRAAPTLWPSQEAESPAARQRAKATAEAEVQARAPGAATLEAASGVTLVAPERQSKMVPSTPPRPAQTDVASPPSGSNAPTAAPADTAAPVLAALPPLTAAAGSQAAATPAPREAIETAAQADRRLIATLLARGERDLADGNVAMARQCFLRAAEAGMARGALLLAQTYDAHELARLGAQGMQGNARLARIWYQRARELGASEAEPLLRRLGGAD